MLPMVARKHIQWTSGLLIPIANENIDSPMIVDKKGKQESLE